jgi:hypothetical protein
VLVRPRTEQNTTAGISEVEVVNGEGETARQLPFMFKQQRKWQLNGPR